jgi:hypothetical protein
LLARVCVVLALAAATLAVTSASGWAQRAPGGVEIFDEPGCFGVAIRNDAKVTVPFSILVTGLTAGSTTSQFFVTDLNVAPPVEYGPFTIPPVGSDGTVCAEVLSAPAGHWMVEVVEEGSGFRDSKAFIIEPTPTTTTTAPPTTAPPTTPPPTTAPPTTTTGAPSTTTTPTTTIAAEVIRRPWSELPWVIVFSTTASTPTTTAPTTSSLPSTGAGAVAAIAVGGVLVLTGLPLLRAARRR